MMLQGPAERPQIDGGFQRTGKAGYSSIRRVLLTSWENFRSGMKIQIIGTVIDLIGDANTIFIDENGSKDISEFLGRACVSLVKAGATAALGSLFAAGAVAFVTAAMTVGALPVLFTVGIVVAGYVHAATLVDVADDCFNIKTTISDWTR